MSCLSWRWSGGPTDSEVTDEIVEPLAVGHLSTGDGQIYQYSRRRGTSEDVHAWYLSAVDYRTGQVTSERFVGSGKALDSPMLSTNFWPGHTAVTGLRNGLVVMRNGP